jgi:GNAT superfamily N-acetyltransferase
MSETSKFYDVPADKIAAVVTYLEMRTAPQGGEASVELHGDLRRVENPDPDWYLNLFRRIGEELLWFGRLTLSKEQLSSILRDPDNEVYVLRADGKDAGLLELDYRKEGDCELAYFGIIPELVGTGTGRALMARSIELAWSRPIRRFWLHTCTLDHPRALQFYLRSGFTAYKREIEIADDPRLSGHLPRNSTPLVPIIKA